MLKINAGLKGGTLSGHHMTTGFGPLELQGWKWCAGESKST